MTCADFENLLDDQFGPALLSDDPALIEHAAACGPCRTMWERNRLLADAIGAWRAQAPDVDLTAAVLAALEPQTAATGFPAGSLAANPKTVSLSVASTVAGEPTPNSARRSSKIAVINRSRRSLVTVALALTALVAVVTLAPILHNASRPANSSVTSRLPNAGKATQPSDDNVLVPEKWLIARAEKPGIENAAPYAGLVQLAAGAWDEVSLIVRPDSKNSPAPEPVPQGAATDGWIDGLQQQLKPIGRGLDNAFDFLWQAGQSGDG